MPVIVKEMGAKGRGLVATKDMEMGTLIVKERAAVKVRKGFQAAMGDEAFGREIERQISNLSKEEQEEFFKLSKNKKTMLHPSATEKYKEIIAIFNNNSILSTESELCVFNTVSLLNHSCNPNAGWNDVPSRYCEAQARVRQGSARDGSQGKRPQSLNPCLELTLKLVDPPSFPPPPPGRLILPD